MRRLAIKTLAVLAVCGSAASFYRAYVDFRSPPTFPPPGWRVRWPDHLMDGAWGVLIAVTCGIYENRRHQDQARGGDPALGYTKWAPLWRQRWEWRILIYGFAARALLILPVAYYKATQSLAIGMAVRKRYPQLPIDPWEQTFREAIRIGDLIGLAAACALVIYDRFRILRERKIELASTGHCITCGYDLRATPHRCPECGTIVRKTAVQTAKKPGLEGVQ